MRIEKKSFCFLLSIMFAVGTISLLIQSCSCDTKPIANDLNIISLVSFMDPDTWQMPELSEKEANLVDSISKLEEYINYRNAYKQLIEKSNSYFASLSPKELEELAKNATDSVFVSNFMSRMKSSINIKNELRTVEKASNEYDKIIGGLKLTEAEKIALIIKKFK